MTSSGNRYKIIAFAPFGPAPDADSKTILHNAALEIRDRLYQEMGPSLYFSTPPELCPQGGITPSISGSPANSSPINW